MFCYQCEQTAKGNGCTISGVCGKNEDIQSLQDILLFGLKGMAAQGAAASQLIPTETKMPMEVIDRAIQVTEREIQQTKDMVTGQLQSATEQKILRDNAKSTKVPMNVKLRMAA